MYILFTPFISNKDRFFQLVNIAQRGYCRYMNCSRHCALWILAPIFPLQKENLRF